MHPLAKIFFTGMFISFLGSLLVEMIYVRLSLVGMDWISKQEKIFKILEWVTLAIVVALAISSFHAALHPKTGKNIILSSTLPRFVLGATMCAVNPVQIPFWFGWSTVLFTKKVLLPKNSHYNLYIIGIGIGTFIGNCVFIFVGQLIAEKLRSNQNILNWVIGGILSITAVIQVWRIVTKKDAVHNLENPDEVAQKLEKKFAGMHKDHSN